MAAVRTVKLFRNGRNQAVRIPREFELPGEEAVMRRMGAALVLEPAEPASVLDWLRTLSELDDAWPEIADPPPAPVRM